jgi:hypothetical protein
MKSPKNQISSVLSIVREYQLSQKPEYLLEAISLFGANRQKIIRALENPVYQISGWINPEHKEQFFSFLKAQTGYAPNSIKGFKRMDLKSFLPKWRKAGSSFEIIRERTTNHELDEFETTFQSVLNNDFRVKGNIDRSDLLLLGELVSTQLLDCLVTVLEATCDAQVAKLLLISLPEIDIYRQLKLDLISGNLSSNKTYSGWKKLELSTPSWTNLEAKHQSFRQHFPENYNFGIIHFAESIRTIPAPLRKYAVVHDALVTHGGTITSDNKLIENDPVQSPFKGFVAGRWDHVVGTNANISEAYVKISPASANIHRAILLSGRADSNWFHWLFEYLPRLLQLEDTIPQNVPVLISEETVAAGKEALSIISGREILTTKRDDVVFVRDLFVPGPSLYHPDSTFVPWEKGTSLDFQAIDKIREQIHSHFGTSEPPTRKIYWRRDSTHRNIENQDDIIRTLVKEGFEVIQPEGLSLSEQFEVFNSAKIVISAMGAMTPNFLFMQEQARVISLTSDASRDYVLPGIIASRYISKYISVVGKQISSGNEQRKLDFFHNNFIIKRHDLLKAIREIEKS